MKLPKVNKCCFCFSVRWGIIIFGYINIFFSMMAVSCLVVTTELQKMNVKDNNSIELLTSTILFSIFGMGVILNILLLFAGYQKDVEMLRLYNYYAIATTVAALIPTFILVSKHHYIEVFAALFAIAYVPNKTNSSGKFIMYTTCNLPNLLSGSCVQTAMQCYVIVLVRSEVLKLENKRTSSDGTPRQTETNIDVPDTVTLI